MHGHFFFQLVYKLILLYRAVCEKEISEEYMEYIRAIFVKNSIIDEYRQDYPETRAFIELQPVLEKLRVKVQWTNQE